MIPRALLFGNPVIGSASISPDGRWLAWSADVGGVMNLWVALIDDPAAGRQVTFDRRRGVSAHSWSRDSAFLLFGMDTDGDENYRLYAVDVAGGSQRCLTPFDGTRAAVRHASPKTPGRVLIGLNRRDRRNPDLFTLDLVSGEMSLVHENAGHAGFIVDDDYRVRFAVGPTPQGGRQLLAPDGHGGWTPVSVVRMEDVRSTGWSHLDATGSTLYGYDSRGRDTAALVATDLATGRSTVLGSSELADVSGMLTDSRTYRPLAFWTHHERAHLHLLDDTLREDAAFLQTRDLSDWRLASRTQDDRLWLLGTATDTVPGVTWLYDRQARTLQKLFVHRPGLMSRPLARMQSTVVRARDGLPLVCYFTLPRAADAGGELQARAPQPLVLFVHGGPWDRDYFGFNVHHQWLADRGYAVLSVNFRASTGFGKAFANAGDGQWGRQMGDDLEDAVDWAITRGLADARRIAIVGGSYGGFAVLSALTRHPGRCACGVDIVGPSNLESLLAAIPPHWEHERQMLHRAVGDPTTPAGREDLRSRSPLHAAGAIADPLLIAQGANDPRVPCSEAEHMVQALASRGIPVTYLLFPDEGHGFSREPNRLVFNAAMEAFLAQHLGGDLEPFALDDFPGHSMRIEHGREHLTLGTDTPATPA